MIGLSTSPIQNNSPMFKRFLPGDLSNVLWISRHNDEMTGLTLRLQDGVPKLKVGFNAKRQAEELIAFRNSMRESGYSATDNYDIFNGGFGEKHRQTNLRFTLPGSADEVIRAVETASALPQPGAGGEGYFIKGDKVQKQDDPLSEIL